MWQLYMLIMVWHGNSTFGGPIVVDGFKTETACINHSQKIAQNTPQAIDLYKYSPDAKPKVVHAVCVKLEK